MTLVHIAGKFPAIIPEAIADTAVAFCINTGSDQSPIWQSIMITKDQKCITDVMA